MDAASIAAHFGFFMMLATISAVLVYGMLKKARILDVPNERSSHTKAIPRSGGIAIVAALIVGYTLHYAMSDVTRLPMDRLLPYLAGLTLLAGVSAVDDIRGVPPLLKFATQVASALIMVGAGVVVSHVTLPFVGEISLGPAGYAVTLLWIVGLTNAFNFMDGLDGLAGGTAVLVSLFLALVALQSGSLFVYIASAILASATLGFLVFNFPPARIFMGDTGSQTIGFSLAALGVIAGEHDAAHTSYLAILLLVFNFLWDTAFTILRRAARGDNVAVPHREHLYQLLNRIGWSHRRVTCFHLAVTFAQGMGALGLLHFPDNRRVLVFVPFVIFQAAYTAWVMRAAGQADVLPKRG